MAANRILLVEDDHAIADAVALNLRTVGYEVSAFDDGGEAAATLEKDHSFDIALLDIMLPGLDGFALFALMEKYNIPVIYMTAKTDSESEVRGLKEGAEDYIVKPFEIVTLLVRIERVLARTGRLNQVYRFRDLTLDAENRTLTYAGEPIDLPPLEFDVLAVLMKNKNRTVSRERILNEIWGEDYFGDIRWWMCAWRICGKSWGWATRYARSRKPATGWRNGGNEALEKNIACCAVWCWC